MFDEVLKFGSYIVDALVDYSQPVFVYIPPGGDLRGGAWVVVDSTINSDTMEMFAAPSSRGGVLEPAGTVGLKYRHRHLVATAHRLDPVLRELDASTRNEEMHSGELADQIAAREKLVLPVYQQI